MSGGIISEKIHVKNSSADGAASGYVENVYGQPYKRYCQTLELVPDQESIEKYKYLHSPEAHWSEVREGIRAVGILEMEIFIFENRLFMIVDTPLDFDWDEAMAKLSALPRQKEWEDTVAVFQICRPGSDSSEKWQLMERIFHLYK